jgi:hypothetical protein
MNLSALHRRLMRTFWKLATVCHLSSLPRDLIDIHAASQPCSNTELESLGRRHAWDEQFSLSELKARLDGAEWYDDQAFTEYGLSADQITDLRR